MKHTTPRYGRSMRAANRGGTGSLRFADHAPAVAAGRHLGSPRRRAATPPGPRRSSRFAPDWLCSVLCIPGMLQFPTLIGLMVVLEAPNVVLLALPVSWLCFHESLYCLVSGHMPRSIPTLAVDVLKGRFGVRGASWGSKAQKK